MKKKKKTEMFIFIPRSKSNTTTLPSRTWISSSELAHLHSLNTVEAEANFPHVISYDNAALVSIASRHMHFQHEWFSKTSLLGDRLVVVIAFHGFGDRGLRGS